MRLNYRSKEKIEKDIVDLKKWMSGWVDMPAEEMGDFFAKRIDGYENVHLKNWEGEYKQIPHLLPSNINTMLDIGCGSGLELDEIFKKFPNLNVTGIDICQSMLDKLKDKHMDKNIDLIQADYYKYAFEDVQYDTVISVLSLHHNQFDEKQAIYDKMYKSVKKGGFYLEVDYMAVNEEWEQLNLDYYKKRMENTQIDDDVFVHIDLPLTVEHQIKLFENAGFNDIQVLNKPFDTDSNVVFMKGYKN